MKAVVMECRIRVCGSTGRLREFIDQASSRALNAFPKPVKCSLVVEDSDSLLLRRQWHRENDVDDFGVPVGKDVCLAFADSSGRLTASKLESLSRDILADLELDPWATELPAGSSTSGAAESVPWILTLSTDVDRASREEIAARHPMLDLRAKPLITTS
ncbi:hypothetical protein GOAMI_13_00850 [Gordonia amicalis NBRC 100051 = JCM 11271]|nr:hypothetical protein GOAMI_13_00850 [Gordonia amicalis NBRC 100051 = JCM 11271]